VTAKIGGSSSPCRKRQSTMPFTLVAVASITIGTAMTIIAVAITRLRPSTSATTPVNGAVNAMAMEVAVITELMRPAPTPNSCASAGSSACGE
jgi:hypothetical protein